MHLAVPSRRPRAFSLIEMVCVIAIIGLLVGVGVANWTQLTGHQKNSRADANLDRVAVTEAQVAKDWNTYTALGSDLADVGADLTLLNGGRSTGETQVSLAVGDQGSLGMAVLSATKVCHLRLLAALSAGGGSTVVSAPAGANCAASSAFTGTEQPITQTGTVKVSG
jgi:prepilin-type N-terminal cleavage/methylation domain-containing protein